MTKKTVITDAEKSEFRDAMGKVKPIVKANKADILSNPPRRSIASKMMVDEAMAKPVSNPAGRFAYLDPDDMVTGDAVLAFKRDGVNNRTWQRLKRGRVAIDARLDLHRLQLEEAAERTERFIAQCTAAHFKTACVIHGKGYRSPNQTPLLKNLINLFLREHPAILAFHSARPRDGGTGAIYILLRSSNSNS